jgi:hypothetical protein
MIGKFIYRHDPSSDERPDSVHLNDRVRSRNGEVRHSLRGESKVASFHGLELLPVETSAHTESPASLYHDDVLVLGMGVRHDDVSRFGMNANDERRAGLQVVAAHVLNPLVHGERRRLFQWHYMRLRRLLGQRGWRRAEPSRAHDCEHDSHPDYFDHEVPTCGTSVM